MRGTHKVFLCFLLPILFVAGALGPVRAQQQEKRIALVVGNGAYSKSPLATTANDAGLIAQTLQAAGFDVVGARDLDGDTLRKSLRDFIQKAQASGPGTVAMIYLAGYGVQLAGENYFIPVDSSIARDTDIPTEALRISDYARQLASIPLKANIIVLDAARAQPFVEGGQQPIASGLALVEPDPNMLIAFNAAPGTVAPEEQGPYGTYAQSLAEMIRTGGLSLPEVFDRVRLRVNENSKGAQVPWDDQKISAQFTFFDRAPDAPPQAAPDQVAAIRNKPIRDLGVQDAYAAALERDTLPAYEDFLAAYPGDPLAKRVMAIVAARREAITWRRTYRADTPDAYWSYLRRYPRGPHAGDARRRLAILTAPLEPPPTFAMMDYDVPPPPPEEIVYVDRPVLYFSDPDFGFAPPPPPPVYFCPPPPPDFVVLPPPLPVVGLFVLPQPLFVPIPVFVRPPVYVAPPPHNIIYANIHNTTVINTVINQAPAALPAGNAAAAAAVAANGPGRPSAMTQVPTAVKQQAQTIQANPNQPLKPSQAALVSNPTAKPAAMMVKPVNATPTAVAPSAAAPPAGHALPAPGSPNAPSQPVGAGVQPPVQMPGGKPSPTATAPGANAPPQQANAPAAAPAPGQPKQPDAHALPVPGAHGAPPAPGRIGAPPSAVQAPGAHAPGGKPAPNAPVPTAAAPATSTPPTAGHPPGPGHAVAPPPASATAKPAVNSVKPAPPVPPPPAARQQIRPEPPRAAAPPPRPQISARPAPAPPPPRAAPPPPRAAPPPPRMAAPPPRPAPPVAAARPAPPPVARPAPPPPPRVAVAPPPRPAPPPPRPAAPAPKKCPPNQPKC
ncbi:caspase family protein [Bradyrhizobium manausense]|uniref:caspase family protein n=1 Tax=Bradyrhizobium manausense TaxID=989370 RepID=UPI001BABB8F9|nr:caspase domain-containing protein [Bradyrhizobium manausense]MBR0789124.1 caspase family protein [Bradyrhizobium manausense]